MIVLTLIVKVLILGLMTIPRPALGASLESYKNQKPWLESFEAGLESFEGKNFDQAALELDQVIAKAPISDQLAQAYVLKGAIDKLQGQPQSAVRQYQYAYDVYQKTSQSPLAARQLVHIANTYKDFLSQYGLALRHYEEAEKIFTEFGLEDERLSAVIDRGNTYLDIGQSDLALSTLENSLARIQPSTQWMPWTRAALMVARVQYRRGTYDEAGQYLKVIEKILEHAMGAPDLRSSLKMRSHVDTIKIDVANLKALVAGESGFGLVAIETLKKTLAEDGIPPQKRATLYNNLGYWLREEGAPEEALLVHKKAFEIDRTLYQGDNANIAFDYRNLGLAWLAQGDESVAAGYLQDALRLSLTLGIPYNGGFSALGLGDIAAMSDRWSEAQSYYQKAFELANAVGAKNLEWFALSQGGQASLIQGDVDFAVSQFERAYDIAKKIQEQIGNQRARLAFKSHKKYQTLVAQYLETLRSLGRDRESMVVETEFGEGY